MGRTMPFTSVLLPKTFRRCWWTSWPSEGGWWCLSGSRYAKALPVAASRVGTADDHRSPPPPLPLWTRVSEERKMEFTKGTMRGPCLVHKSFGPQCPPPPSPSSCGPRPVTRTSCGPGRLSWWGGAGADSHPRPAGHPSAGRVSGGAGCAMGAVGARPGGRPLGVPALWGLLH